MSPQVSKADPVDLLMAVTKMEDLDMEVSKLTPGELCKITMIAAGDECMYG